MTEQLIDLTKIDFWLICLVATILLAPLTQAAARKVLWAIINVAFVFIVLGWNAVAIVLAVPVLYLLVNGIAGRLRLLATVLAGLAISSLFVLHKLPPLAIQAGLGSMSGVLSIIGFSYVALRMVELVRAVFEKRHPPPDMLSIINYLVPFHMLAAGPIQAYDDYVAQPAVPSRSLSRLDVLEAAERITTGLFKKFVLAYAIQKAFLTDFEADGLYFFFEVQVFFLWLFLDFSAYTDLAVGIGRLLGIATPENFDKPYLARNAIDFWNRWHISLSMFIRRNIFIPLQLHLTRKTDGRRPLMAASIAFSVAFVLCGLWHGLTLNFLLWGTIHAAALVIANLWREYLKKRLGTKGVRTYMKDKRIKWLARLVTYEYVAFSLVVLFIP